MKKLLVLLISAVLAASLVSCGDSDKTNPDTPSVNAPIDFPGDNPDDDTADVEVTASVTDNEGTTTNLTANELIEIFDANQARFNKYYTGSNINVTTKIKSISLEDYTMVSDSIWDIGHTVVVLEGGWCLVNPPQDLSYYMAGDEVQISGSVITAATHLMLQVHGPTKSDRVVWLDGSNAGILTDGNSLTVPAASSLTASELIEIFNGNQSRFNRFYTNADITASGVVSKIVQNAMTMKADNIHDTGHTVVILENGWCIVDPTGDIADFMPGDTVNFSGKIITATTHDLVKVHGPTNEPVVWVDGSNGTIG